jgi:hypothetical protein
MVPHPSWRADDLPIHATQAALDRAVSCIRRLEVYDPGLTIHFPLII